MILLTLAALAAAPASPDARPIPPKPAEARPAASRFTAPTLGDAELGAQAGRADIAQDSRTTQSAGVSGSSVNGTSRTGAVTIDGNAFQNMSGLTVVNANSGNNVAMNGSMTVNVAITPKP